jgi:hypothetical protein
MVKVTDADVKRATDWLAIPIDTPARRSERDRLAVRFALHRIAGAKAALEKAAELCNERGAYEREGFGLSRATQNYFRARDAIRNIDPEECE